MKKKIFVQILCITYIFAMISGCGFENNTAEGVSVVNIWNGESHANSFYVKIWDRFNRTVGAEKGIRVNYKLVGNVNEVMKEAIQNGKEPDMISGALDRLVAEDRIVAINDLPGGRELIDFMHTKYGDSIFKYSKNVYMGKVYSLPYCNTTQGLIYNKKMFKDAGLIDEKGEPTPPKTFSEMREYAKILTNEEKQQYGLILPLKWEDWILGEFGGSMQRITSCQEFNPETGEFDYTPFKPIIDIYLGMRDDGSIFPGGEEINNDAARAYFAEGNIGMKMGYSFDYRVLTEQFPTKMEWGVAPCPLLDDADEYAQRSSYGYTQYVNKKSLTTIGGEKILEIIKFMLSDEFQKTAYEDCAYIPFDSNIIKDTKIENRDNWEEFGKMLSISEECVLDPLTNHSSEYRATLCNRFMEEVWNGNKSSEQFCKEITDYLNEEKDKYFKNNPSDSIENYIEKGRRERIRIQHGED